MSRSSGDAEILLGKRKKNRFLGFYSYTCKHNTYTYTTALVWLCNIKSSASPLAANKHETAHK